MNNYKLHGGFNVDDIVDGNHLPFSLSRIPSSVYLHPTSQNFLVPQIVKHRPPGLSGIRQYTANGPFSDTQPTFFRNYPLVNIFEDKEFFIQTDTAIIPLDNQMQGVDRLETRIKLQDVCSIQEEESLEYRAVTKTRVLKHQNGYWTNEFSLTMPAIGIADASKSDYNPSFAVLQRRDTLGVLTIYQTNPLTGKFEPKHHTVPAPTGTMVRVEEHLAYPIVNGVAFYDIDKARAEILPVDGIQPKNVSISQDKMVVTGKKKKGIQIALIYVRI
tara:strand:+ start:16004 stop:16822 length:819 start_codon:yes stop_codon:yes gene_type:complete